MFQLRKWITCFNFCLFIFCTNPIILYSQQDYFLRGNVIDSHTKEPLAFVNITLNNIYKTYQTDIDGVFNIPISSEIDSLKLSYVGYETATYKITNQYRDIKIELKRNTINLSEVVIFPGENPAHRIINNVIENRNKNNPEKLSSFSYTSYNKMTFTANLDSLKNNSITTDTTILKAKKLLEKQYLFLMESIIERKFLYPDNNNEKLIASKISGFKDPLFALLVTQMQSFSFYNEVIHIGDKNYINPISKGSIDKYFFLIEDTLIEGKDSVYIISFQPKKNKNFDGLKGALYIHTNQYAIQNVIAEPFFQDQAGITVKIQQKYEFLEQNQWFPVQLNSDFTFINKSLNKIKVIGQGRSYLQKIKINPEMNKKDFSPVELQLNSVQKGFNDTIWKTHRMDSLTEKDRKTYYIVDSIGKANNFDRIIKTSEALILGKIPIKFVDIELNKIIHFNDYEGFRLGMGLSSNEKFSKHIFLNGYFAYGFSDKDYKYGTDVAYAFNDKHDITIGISYLDDVTESGEINFYEKQGFLSDDYFRRYMIQRMDKSQKSKGFIRFTILKYVKTEISLSQIAKSVTNSYTYGVKQNNISLFLNEFNFTELTVGLAFAFKEKYIQTLRYKISSGTKYPIVWINYVKGFKNLLKGEYAYNRYDIKGKKSFFIKHIGTSSIQIQGGYIDGDLPYCNLFNGIGSYRQFTISAPNSFETMRMNEFLSNKYAALFYTHSFGKLLFRFNKFSPELAIATNACIGSLNNKEKHFNIDFKTLQKGYMESGVLINKIIDAGFYGLGVGAYYRFGPNSLPTFKENMAYKFSLSLNM